MLGFSGRLGGGAVSIVLGVTVRGVEGRGNYRFEFKWVQRYHVRVTTAHLTMRLGRDCTVLGLAEGSGLCSFCPSLPCITSSSV